MLLLKIKIILYNETIVTENTVLEQTPSLNLTFLLEHESIFGGAHVQPAFTKLSFNFMILPENS